MITVGIDKENESLTVLVAQALRDYPTDNLYSFLEDKNCVVRSAAAREIQIRGEEKSFNVVQALLKDKRSYVREIAVFVLGQLGTPNYPFKQNSVPLITECLNLDRSSIVRAAAAAALGHLKAHESLDALKKSSVDKSAQVRECTAFALNNMKRYKKAREILSTLKNDTNENVHSWISK